ncbi:MAG: hypothetical protein Q4D76_12150 [Oscillospiraceae bacterium]|nr:hypothetical protein [Oscillospiraceae bacterium]
MAFSVKKIPLRANRLPLRAKLLYFDFKTIIIKAQQKQVKNKWKRRKIQ